MRKTMAASTALATSHRFKAGMPILCGWILPAPQGPANGSGKASSAVNLSAVLLATLLAPMSADWPTYGYDFTNTRHAPLAQINAANVASLVPAWRFAADAAGPMESSPIVVRGTMYVTTADRDGVIALDAATGAMRWQYWPKLGHFFFCCAKVNRGVAVAAGRVFVGSAGAEFGVRGSFSAYRAADGRLLWRWWATNPGWEGAYVTSVHGYSLHRDIAAEKADAARYRDAWR